MIPVKEQVELGHLQEAMFTLHWGKVAPAEMPQPRVNWQGVYNAQLRLEELQVLPIKLGALLEKNQGLGHV